MGAVHFYSLCEDFLVKQGNSWLVVPAQPVDATPSNRLIRQSFPLENRSVRFYSIRPSQGGVPIESTLANYSYLLSPLQVDFELVLRRPIETARITGHLPRPVISLVR